MTTATATPTRTVEHAGTHRLNGANLLRSEAIHVVVARDRSRSLPGDLVPHCSELPGLSEPTASHLGDPVADTVHDARSRHPRCDRDHRRILDRHDPFDAYRGAPPR